MYAWTIIGENSRKSREVNTRSDFWRTLCEIPGRPTKEISPKTSDVTPESTPRPYLINGQPPRHVAN